MCYPGFGYDIEVELGVDQGCCSLGQVSLIWNQTGSAETTRTTQLMHPLGPLWV